MSMLKYIWTVHGVWTGHAGAAFSCSTELEQPSRSCQSWPDFNELYPCLKFVNSYFFFFLISRYYSICLNLIFQLLSFFLGGLMSYSKPRSFFFLSVMHYVICFVALYSTSCYNAISNSSSNCARLWLVSSSAKGRFPPKCCFHLNNL